MTENNRTTDLRVDAERLWRSLMDMAQVGALPHGGCSRTALSEADGEGRHLFRRWCLNAGCDVKVDRVGNIYARREGTEPQLPATATGSHLDTQPHGGRFDGVFGVLAGLEAIRTLNDARVRTRASIDLVVWTNEEGTRFQPPLAGSSAFVGRIAPGTLLGHLTMNGTTVEQDLKAIGFLGEESPGARRFSCFIEAHIEQGPILEAQGVQIGVVTGVQAIRILKVTFIGQDAHAGTTPMDRRKDALLGAAHSIVRLTELAKQTDAQTRLTVGSLSLAPNSISTICGSVTYTVDIRNPRDEILDSLERDIHRELSACASAARLSHSVIRTAALPATKFSPKINGSAKRAAQNLGYPFLELSSGAGHDAMNLAQVVPTGMIFVPCRDGISHNEAESAKIDDLAAGANVLLHTLLLQAEIAE